MEELPTLIEQFFGSPEWIEVKEKEGFKHKRVMKNAIRLFLRRRFGILDEVKETPLEIEKATGLVEHAIRSKWAKKAAGTRAKKKKLKERELTRRAKIAIGKFTALKSPLLFGQQLTVQHKPVNPNKPRRKVA